MLLLCGCPNPEPEPDTLSVSPTRVTFAADDTKEEIVNVTTNVDAWEFYKSDSWVSAIQSGDELRLSVQNYDGTEEPRYTKVTISAGTADVVEIAVTQAARNTLAVNPEAVSFNADETGSKTVAITTSASSWEATTGADWIVLSKQGNALTVTVNSGNTSSSARVALISITGGNAPERTVTVTQAARHTLSVGTSSLTFAAGSSSQTVSISTSAPSWDAATDVSWITLTKQSGSLQVNVAANSGSARNGSVTVTAGNAAPVTIAVRQDEQPVTTYRTAVGQYYGNAANTGTAYFSIDLYNFDPNVGLYITAFCTLTDYNSFRVTAGTYTIANTGARMTFYPGRVTSDTSVGGTIDYNFNTKKFIRVTGGTFTVESSGSSYTITTNFSGVDHATGAAVDNIRATYTGTISFSCEADECQSGCTPPFGSFCESNYTASGSASNVNWPTSWSGVISPKAGSSTNYYTISRWGNTSNMVFCDYVNSRIILDDYTKIVTVSGMDFYFRALAVNQSQGIAYEVDNYEAKYNASTQTLDFTGTYSGYPIAVGLVADNNEGGFTFMYLYSNLKLKLTSTSSAPRSAEERFSIKRKSAPAAVSKASLLQENALQGTPVAGGSPITLKRAPRPATR
jgi:hypothetical protein